MALNSVDGPEDGSQQDEAKYRTRRAGSTSIMWPLAGCWCNDGCGLFKTSLLALQAKHTRNMYLSGHNPGAGKIGPQLTDLLPRLVDMLPVGMSE